MSGKKEGRKRKAAGYALHKQMSGPPAAPNRPDFAYSASPQFSLTQSAPSRGGSNGTIPAVRRTGSAEPAAAAAQPKRGVVAAAARPPVAAKSAAVPAVDDSLYRSQLAELNDQVGGTGQGQSWLTAFSKSTKECELLLPTCGQLCGCRR